MRGLRRSELAQPAGLQTSDTPPDAAQTRKPPRFKPRGLFAFPALLLSGDVPAQYRAFWASGPDATRIGLLTVKLNPMVSACSWSARRKPPRFAGPMRRTASSP